MNKSITKTTAMVKAKETKGAIMFREDGFNLEDKNDPGNAACGIRTMYLRKWYSALLGDPKEFDLTIKT